MKKNIQTDLEHLDEPTASSQTVSRNDVTSTEASQDQSSPKVHPEKVTEELVSSIPTDQTNSPCTVCREEKRAARAYAWKLVAGLFLPFSLQALDATIVAGALPFIASDFQELSQLNWITTSAALTSATFIPAWGQFADIFGRHAALQASLVIMLVGSALCSGAPLTAFPMFLVGRALQGVSCAGINILTHAILADRVSLKENAKNNTIFALVGGVGYAVGPVIGGYLTQVNWRLVFIINLPIAGLSMIAVFFILRPELVGPQIIVARDGDSEGQNQLDFKSQLLTIDYGGQVLFLFGMGMLVLALTWGGSYYAWSDAKVLVPLILGLILFVSFLVWEYLMMPGNKLAVKFPRQLAMVPMRLVWSRNAGILFYINFITGMALYAVFYFVTLYFSIVLAYPPGKSGIQLLYYTPGLGVGAYLAMFTCNIYPRQTWFPLSFGTIIEPLGITILAVALGRDNIPLIYGMLGLTGVGTGIRFMPGTLHGVGYFPNDIASVMSLMSLAITLGGTFAMTLMFTIFNNSLEKAGISFKTGEKSSSSSFDQISNLPVDFQKYLRDETRTALMTAFFAMGAFLWVGLVAVSFLGNVKITKEGKGLEGEGKRDFSENVVVKGSYLGSLLRKRPVPGAREKQDV